MVKELSIGEKKVYVFEEHHYAIDPWVNTLKENGNNKVNLLTLDYHTDTKPCFSGYVFSKYGTSGSEKDKQNLIDSEVKSLKGMSETDIDRAIKNLKYDEHIFAAIKANIINSAFVICHDCGSSIKSDQKIQRNKEIEKIECDVQRMLEYRKPVPEPHTYSCPEDRIIVLPKSCSEYSNADDTEGFDRPYSDSVLESSFLNPRLAFAKDVSFKAVKEGFGNLEYILDIDLDYFRTEKSIEPSDNSGFYSLIKNALCVTIARESSCVEELKIEGESINSSCLEEKLLWHIEQAMA